MTTSLPSCYRHPGVGTGVVCRRCGRPICAECMVDAAVGFQCPECAPPPPPPKRAGRARPRRAAPRFTWTPARVVVAWFVGINVAVWLAAALTGGEDGRLIDLFALSPLGSCSSATVPGGWYSHALTPAMCAQVPDGSWSKGVATGAFWQPLTSMFTHASWLHLVGNMFSLFVLGPPLATVMGRAKFVAVYLISALSASAAVCWLETPESRTVGASGPICGLLGAYVVISLVAKAGRRSALIVLGLSVVFSVAVPDISWQGHLGGFVAGCLLAAARLVGPPRWRLRQEAVAYVLVPLLVVAAIVWKAVLLAPG